jgi:hypothetical protein
MFDFLHKFNRVIALDEELARQLPEAEFELRFDDTGNIYINGKPAGMNVEQRHQALRLLEEKTLSDTELATSAFEVLNDLMGEIHGARVPGYLAVKRPEIFATAHHKFIVRISIGATVLALRKFDDIWTHQIAPILLSDNLPSEGVELSREIRSRRLRTFCNLVVAHYSESRVSPKTPLTKIEELLNKQGFASDEKFFEWTENAVTKIGVVRDRIAVKYGLSSR